MSIGSVNFKQDVQIPQATQTVKAESTAAKPDISAKPDKFVKSQPAEQVGKTSETKRILTGASSYLITGLGQAINGQWGKAAGFFFGTSVLGAALALTGFFPLVKAAWLVMATLSAVDAYKNA